MAEAQQELDLEEVEVELPEGKQAQVATEEGTPVVQEESAKESSEEELEGYSKKVQRRIDNLTAKMRETERREQAAIKYAEALKAQVEEQAKKATTADTQYVSEFEGRIKATQDTLQSKLRDAIDRGDTEAQVQAQTELANLASENVKLSYIKKAQETEAKTDTVAETPPSAAVAPPKPAPDPKASAWASKNSWFGSDEPMTLTAFSHHKALVESEGFDPASDDYYEELDSRMKRDFPHKYKEEEQPRVVNQPRGPVVASTTRGSGRVTKKTVKLNKSEVAIAKRLGVPLEKYAEQLAMLETRKG
tara:strand:+ start:1090 stop:2004 length:915 start_codon:yes stop_codon:yes gene_type:complete